MGDGLKRAGADLVGLWPSDHQLFSGGDEGNAIGADHYARSLAEAVELCLSEAQQDSAALQPRESAQAF